MRVKKLNAKGNGERKRVKAAFNRARHPSFKTVLVNVSVEGAGKNAIPPLKMQVVLVK